MWVPPYLDPTYQSSEDEHAFIVLRLDPLLGGCKIHCRCLPGGIET